MPEPSDAAVWRGRLLVLAAAILWSTGGFFAKAPIFSDWPPESRGLMLAFWRALFASLILILLVRRVQWSVRMIPMALAYAVMNWTYLNALVLSEPTVAIWLQYSAPAWVFLISFLWFRERPLPRDWLMLILATLGVAIILSAELRGASPAGIKYGLASGVSFALVVVTIRWNREFDAAWLVFLNNTVTALVFAPAMLAAQVLPHGEQWFYLIGFGMLQIGIPYVLFAIGVKSISSHEASGLVLLEPILVPIWVFVAWRNTPDYQFPAATTLIGGGCILVGLVLRYWGAQRRKRLLPHPRS